MKHALETCKICGDFLRNSFKLNDCPTCEPRVKHTQGPWFVDTESPTDVRTDGINKMMWIVDASVGHDDSNIAGMQEREANARLIAAAPELLEALVSMERLYMTLLKKSGSIDDSIAFNARQAIAKATGDAT